MLRQNARNYENKKLLNKDNEEDCEETELFLKKSPYKEIETVEKQIDDGDTLQAISVRYNCPIAELKRLNNIHKENEIYAKRTIKVPAKVFTMALVHISGTSSPKFDDDDKKNEIDRKVLEEKLKNVIINADEEFDNVKNVNSLIFNSNIVATKSCDIPNDEIEEISDEEVNLIPNEIKPVEPVVTKYTCSGADADISWIALVICIVIVIFAVPMIYIFYIAEHPAEFHHHKKNNT